MTYGIDFRKRVIAYVQSGHTKKKPVTYLVLEPIPCTVGRHS